MFGGWGEEKNSFCEACLSGKKEGERLKSLSKENLRNCLGKFDPVGEADFLEKGGYISLNWEEEIYSDKEQIGPQSTGIIGVGGGGSSGRQTKPLSKRSVRKPRGPAEPLMRGRAYRDSGRDFKGQMFTPGPGNYLGRGSGRSSENRSFLWGQSVR